RDPVRRVRLARTLGVRPRLGEPRERRERLVPRDGGDSASFRRSDREEADSVSNDVFPVKPQIAERAHLRSMAGYRRLYRRSLENPEEYWGEQARMLDWYHPWHKVLDADPEEIDFAWYSGGRLNACYNCVDRHLETRGEQTAILWAADEPGVYRHVS